MTKLKEASSLVDDLKSGASEKRHELGIKQKEADIALQNISTAMADASQQKQQMLDLNNLADKEKRKIAERKSVIDEQLKGVQPLIEQAKEAVGCIRPKDLGEISALRAPPETVRDILEATLTLMGIFDTSWQTMKNFLRKRTFRDDIIAFDAREISLEARAQAKAKVKHCATSFTETQAKRASTAAAPLAQWVKAQLQYAEALDEVAPLEKENSKLVSGLANVQKKQDILAGQLSVHDQKIASLKSEFEAKTGIATKLELGLKNAESTCNKAGSLIGKLSEEKVRWQQEEQFYSAFGNLKNN